ncbi:hypothetical protein [Nocardia brevicatena]|uniref:hypothetical protein n=1 Tax=Nocardia brevicatena TaxID=37327 RepID=UPI0002E8B641|nr:hypothetical protein [Nocardia brevicatena]
MVQQGDDRGIRIFPLSDTGAGPYGITVGPDGALWTALETGAVARITPSPRRGEPGRQFVSSVTA